MFRIEADRFRLWRKFLRYQVLNLELGPLVGRQLRQLARNAADEPKPHGEHARHSLPQYAKQRRRPWLRRSG